MDVAGRDAREDFGNADEVFGEWEEERRSRHTHNQVMGHSSRGVGLGEEEVGMGDDFLCRHTDGVHGIEEPDGGEADDEQEQEFPGVGKNALESVTQERHRIVGCLGCRQGEEEEEESEDWKQEDSRKLGEFGEAKGDAGNEDIFRRGVFEEADKSIESEEDKRGTSDIGGDVVVVSDDVGIEGIEGYGKNAGQRPTELSGPEKDPDAEHYGDQDDREACKKQDRVSIVAGDLWTGAIYEHVADRPLLVIAIFPFC